MSAAFVFRISRLGGAAVLTLTLALLVAWRGRMLEGARALEQCQAASARGELREALTSARTAAEARCPTCPAAADGLKKLETLAYEAEARGDNATAFDAWHMLRSARLATSVWSTSSPERARAEVAIARLALRLDTPERVFPRVFPRAAAATESAETRARSILVDDNAPPRGWAFAAIALCGVMVLTAALRYLRS